MNNKIPQLTFVFDRRKTSNACRKASVELRISQTLDKILSNVRQVILDMMQKDNLDIMSIADELDRKRRCSISFIDF